MRRVKISKRFSFRSYNSFSPLLSLNMVRYSPHKCSSWDFEISNLILKKIEIFVKMGHCLWA